MSVKAKLILIGDNKKVTIISFIFDFSRGSDGTGKPTQKAIFNGLWITIETQKEINLSEWALKDTTKQLELHIYPVILGGRTRIIKYSDCKLVWWENIFSSNGMQPMLEKLHIVCAGITDSHSTAEYSVYWRETFTEDTIIPTTLQNKEEEKIIPTTKFD